MALSKELTTYAIKVRSCTVAFLPGPKPSDKWYHSGVLSCMILATVSFKIIFGLFL